MNSLLLSRNWSTLPEERTVNLMVKSIINHFNYIQQILIRGDCALNDNQLTLLRLLNEGLNLEYAVKAAHIDTQSDSKKCKCGQYLVKINDASSLYNGNGARCDICDKSGAVNEEFWHCDSNVHQHGFDICCSHKRNSICDGKSLKTCEQFIALVVVMNKFNKYQNENKINDECIPNVNTLDVLNNYLHLLNVHDTDQEFELIANILRYCDISTCESFRRNRIQFCGDDEKYSGYLDKIHCYFQHCYDIGDRLLFNEQITHPKNNDAHGCNLLQNKQLTETYNELSIKRKIYDKYINKLGNNYKRSDKYFQLFTNSDSKKYDFGLYFNYGYKGEHGPTANGTNVCGLKYSSLKEELTTNNIAIMSMEQFNHEYRKAVIHFNSNYCKRNSFSFKEYRDKHGNLVYQENTDNKFVTEWIFRVEFSKTYRDDHESQRDSTKNLYAY
eukprot:255209_1